MLFLLSLSSQVALVFEPVKCIVFISRFFLSSYPVLLVFLNVVYILAKVIIF